MKYIVVEVKQQDITREFPFIFPEAIIHSDMYKMAERNLMMELHADSVRCVGAGFISCVNMLRATVGDSACCYGRSESLNVSSRGETDDKLIKLLDYTHGMIL